MIDGAPTGVRNLLLTLTAANYAGRWETLAATDVGRRAVGLDDIPLFAMLKSKMTYVNAREQVVAQNVANADTPDYMPLDLKPFSFAAMAHTAANRLTVDQPGQMAVGPSAKSGALKPVDTPDTEARIDGNQVVLEDQMNKLTEARVDYETAVDLYQQSMSMITTAARAPGKSA
jgi:flagellar basal-body rod protein FlgB